MLVIVSELHWHSPLPPKFSAGHDQLIISELVTVMGLKWGPAGYYRITVKGPCTQSNVLLSARLYQAT
jgi:hypothetical protein